MDRANVSRESVWYARRHPRVSVSAGNANLCPADAAAATDALSVVRTRTGSTRPRVGNQLPAGYYAPAGEIEQACPACTAEWTPQGWQHDRACVMRLAGRR